MAPNQKIKHNNQPKTSAGDEGCIGKEVWPVGSTGGAPFDHLGAIKLGKGVKN
jgi:hypothetical protein